MRCEYGYRMSRSGGFTLTAKTFAVVGLVIAGVYLLTSAILMDGFHRVEREEAVQNVHRAEEALGVELEQLGAIVGDWAPWDDTYAFVQNRNQAYVDSNLVAGVLINFDIHFMTFVDAGGEVVYTYAADLDTTETMPTPAAFLEWVDGNPAFLAHTRPTDIHTGLLLLDDPLLVASAPIVTSEHEGPIVGTLVVGRFLDATKLTQMEDRTRLSLSVYPPDAELPAGLATSREAIAAEGPIVEAVDQDRLAGYVAVDAIGAGAPFVLRAAMPRPVYQQAQRSRDALLWMLVALGGVGAVVIRLLLGRVVRTQQALSASNEALEERVRERTAALEQAGRKLEQMNAQLQYDAFHDALTTLPNRALFMDRLQHAVDATRRQTGTGFGVLFLDTDRFKVINDSLGHAAGDELLIELARRVGTCLRGCDTVARLGGDEFTVLLDGLRDSRSILEVAERIQREALRPYLIHGQTVHASVSIGAVSSDHGYRTAEEVLRDADIALYRAKAMGGAQCELFTLDLRDRRMSLLAVETELPGVLERGELEVHYQPIVSIATGTPTGVEALVRWRSPRLGDVSPAEFLPVAEDTGLIIDIDQWVLREACTQVAAWGRRNPALAGLRLSVNLSGKQFGRRGLASVVAGILEDTGLEASRLSIEITETTLLQPTQHLQQAMTALTQLGVQLHLDDFGTGHSALAYLQHVPVHTLKIDRSFVRNAVSARAGAKLVEMILSMARTLDMGVTAEGIENDGQLELIRRLGCEHAQGFLFARPMHAGAAERWLILAYPDRSRVKVAG